MSYPIHLIDLPCVYCFRRSKYNVFAGEGESWSIRAADSAALFSREAVLEEVKRKLRLWREIPIYQYLFYERDSLPYDHQVLILDIYIIGSFSRRVKTSDSAWKRWDTRRILLHLAVFFHFSLQFTSYRLSMCREYVIMNRYKVIFQCTICGRQCLNLEL